MIDGCVTLACSEQAAWEGWAIALSVCVLLAPLVFVAWRVSRLLRRDA